jgi:hypothetical protein
MLKIYDEFLEDHTICELSDRGYRLHVSALLYCARNLTDGEITERAVKVLQVILGFNVKRYIGELVEAQLWISGGNDGYRIRNYLEFNPSASLVKAEKSAARERMRKLREKRAGDGERSDERAGERNGERSLPPQSSPVHPLEKHLKAVPHSQEIEHEVDKILRHITNPDDGTRGVLLSLACKLPLASVAKVRESCEVKPVGAGYAVNALKDELGARA